jgi:FAM91 N-terminus
MLAGRVSFPSRPHCFSVFRLLSLLLALLFLLGTLNAQALEYSLRHQVVWENSLLKDSVPEKRYYQDMLKVSRQRLMLYPYHAGFALADILQATPFKYYSELMVDVIQSTSFRCVAALCCTPCVCVCVCVCTYMWK